jgi:hypothetical protein
VGGVGSAAVEAKGTHALNEDPRESSQVLTSKEWTGSRTMRCGLYSMQQNVIGLVGTICPSTTGCEIGPHSGFSPLGVNFACVDSVRLSALHGSGTFIPVPGVLPHVAVA